MKNILQSKSRYQKWETFISKNNLSQMFKEHWLYSDDSFAEISNRIINNLSARPTCQCGYDVKFHQNHYQEFCSVKCQSLFNTSKRKQTYKDKTGYEYALLNPDVISTMHSNNIVKYGVAHPMLLPEYKDKVKNTKFDKYGDGGFTNHEKAKATNLKKYGVDMLMGTPNFIEKSKATKFDKYGDSEFNNYEKAKATNLKKYGVENYAQTGLVNGYKWYSYTLPSGRIIKYQGYEGRYIPTLIKKYGESNICFHGDNIPRIKYVYNGITKYYFPDFYIPSKNLIIEIKSNFTLNANKEVNEAKFKSTVDAGYKLKVRVYK